MKPLAMKAIAVAALALAGCEPAPVTLELRGETMGTTYSVIAIDKTADLDREVVQKAIDDALADVNASMSNWDPSSEISVFNAQESTEPQAISAELATVMATANMVHRESMGLFDVTLGPVIELWGFGARDAESPVPSDAAIEAAQSLAGQESVLALVDDPPMLQKLHPDATVYLASIAKGYGVDAVGEALSDLGLRDFMIEIGGDLLAAGSNPDGTAWQIGIERPEPGRRTLQDVVALSGLGLATSGDYRNYFEQDGVRYSHIIDASTGRPITHTTASVTVLADSAMLADAWATALLALGQERGLPVAEKNDLAALFIMRDPSVDDAQFVTAASPRFDALSAAD
ncbi:MAG: FAD:protein FMN transferase [Pseudomonadota bacterium]